MILGPVSLLEGPCGDSADHELELELQGKELTALSKKDIFPFYYMKLVLTL